MIVRALLTDIPAIQQVAHQTWPDTFKEILTPAQIDYMLNWMYSTEALAASINHPNQSFWLFQEEGKTLGFAGIEHQYNGLKATKLHKIYVLPQAQGKQIGKQLLEHVILEARTAGSTALLLNVNRYNNATTFYEKQGFSITNEVNIDIGNGYLMEDFEMELSIIN
jgi:GNAT superfamily N-acetyltransferase